MFIGLSFCLCKDKVRGEISVLNNSQKYENFIPIKICGSQKYFTGNYILQKRQIFSFKQ